MIEIGTGATKSVDDTRELGAALAELARPGDVVLLAGDLGTGKTAFAQGFARGLGVEEPVTSPTFTIGHRYGGRVAVSHLDLYRYAELDLADWGDLEPYFEDAVAFVEWPEAAAGGLRDVRVAVHLRHVDTTRRLIAFDAEKSLLESVFGPADSRV